MIRFKNGSICILVCLIIFLSYSKRGYSQAGPSLAAGINDVTFTKGKLDAEIIAEIIATKKGEIKTELAQRFILRNFECSSYAVYNYIYNATNLLLNETNKEIISKGLLQNSAELLMIYGFAEFYLAELSHRAKTNSLQPHEVIFINEMGKWADLNSGQTIDGSFKTTLVSSRQNDNSYLYQQTQKELDGYKPVKGIKAPVGSSEFLPDIKYLPLFINKKSSYCESDRTCTNIAPVHIYIDMIFEVLQANKKVRDAGFFRGIRDGLKAEKSKFIKIKLINASIYNNIIGHDSLVWKSLENRVDRIFTFYRTLSTLASKVDTNEKIEDVIKIIDDELKGFDLIDFEMKPSTITAFFTLCKTLKDELTNVAIPLIKAQLPAFSPEDKELIQSAEQTINKIINTNFKEDVGELEYYRLVLESELMPKLKVLNTATFGAYTKALSDFELLTKMIKQRGLLGLKVRIDEKNPIASNLREDTLLINHFKKYIKIVDIINNLDKVESYDKVFSYVINTVNTFGSERTKKVMAEIVQAHDRYVTIDKDENQLVLDVESMAVDLYKRFGENNSMPVGIYFSVGISNQFNFSGSSLNVDGTVTNSKFTFASEKIGLRWNILDFNKKYSLGLRSQKPVINNFHWLGYFSGLLYQVEFLNSEDKFKSPLYGTGLGLTFFNGLDLNVSYAVPFENTFKDGFLSLGFDIRITEYLTALKRKKD